VYAGECLCEEEWVRAAVKRVEEDEKWSKWFASRVEVWGEMGEKFVRLLHVVEKIPEHPNSRFLALEYIEGGTLATYHRLHATDLPESFIQNVLWQVTTAL
jgi:hypothetical protein